MNGGLEKKSKKEDHFKDIIGNAMLRQANPDVWEAVKFDEAIRYLSSAHFKIFGRKLKEYYVKFSELRYEFYRDRGEGEVISKGLSLIQTEKEMHDDCIMEEIYAWRN